MLIKTPEFVKHLDSWLFKNDQKDAAYFFMNKAHIPHPFKSYSKKLYRGMTVDKKFIDELKKKGYIDFKNHSSWSKDSKLAVKFATDSKYKIGVGTGTKILISKEIEQAKIIFDIDAYCQFFGEHELTSMGLDELSYDSAVKEQEVLIAKGIRITEKDISMI